MKDALIYTVTPRTNPDGFDRIDIDLPDVRVGNVRCYFEGEKLIIYSIQIFPEFQRRGFARKTINMLKKDYGHIIADRVRFKAREFWTSMGFRELPDGNWECKHVIFHK